MKKIIIIISLFFVLLPNISWAQKKKTTLDSDFILPTAEQIQRMNHNERQLFFENLQQVISKFEKQLGLPIASNFSSDNAIAFWNQIFFDQAMARLPEQMGDAKAMEEAERVRREKRRPRIKRGGVFTAEEAQRLRREKRRPRIERGGVFTAEEAQRLRRENREPLIEMGDGKAMEQVQQSSSESGPMEMGDASVMERVLGGKEIKTADEEGRLPSPQNSDLRCVYAGFVVKGKKCAPPKSLKLRYNINDKMDEVDLKCRRGQLLCNPLIFGVVEKKDKDQPRITKAIEPVCVPIPKDRRNTTRECYLKSAKIKASAVMVVAHNSALWSQFKSDLETLCNPDFNKELPVLKNRKRAIKDVNDTCAWAKVAMTRKTLSEAQKARYNPNQDNSDEDSVANEGVE